MAYFVDDEDIKFPSLLTQDQKARLAEDDDTGRFAGVDTSKAGRMVTPTGDGTGTTTRSWGTDDTGFFRYGIHDKFDTSRPTFMGEAIQQPPPAAQPFMGRDNLVGAASGRVLQPGQWEAYMPNGDIISEGAVSRSAMNPQAQEDGTGLRPQQAPMSSMAGYRDMRVKDDMQAKYDAMRARSDEFLRGPMGAQTLGKLGIRTNEDIAAREQGLRGIETARTEKANREAKEQALFDREQAAQLARIEAAGGIKKDVAATTQGAMTERAKMKQDLEGRKLDTTTVENELNRKARIDEIMARGGVERENDLARIDQEYVNESKLLREKGDIEGARQVDRLRVDSASDMLKAAASSGDPTSTARAMRKLQEAVDGLGGTADGATPAATPAQAAGEAAAAGEADSDGNGVSDQDEAAMAWAKENKKTNPIKAAAIEQQLKAKYPKIYGE